MKRHTPPEPTQEEYQASMVDPPSPAEAAKLADSDEPAVPFVLTAPANTKQVEVDGETYTEAEILEALAARKASAQNKLRLPEDKPSGVGKMLVGECLLKLNQLGSNVPKTGVTPAEVMVLSAIHHNTAGGYPVLGLQIKGEVSRTPVEEARRLRARYGAAKVNAIFPGAIPSMPLTFAEAILVGAETSVPTNSLVEFQVKARSSD